MNKKIKNFILKIIAVFCSIAVWMYISDIVSETKTFKVPLDLMHYKDMIILSQSVEFINVTVKGPSGIISNLSMQDIKVEKDIRDVTEPGNIIIPVQDITVIVPNHVAIERIFPRRVTLNIDKIIEKYFEVNAVIRGKPANGYVYTGKYVVNPQKVLLKGPEQKLKNLEEVNTQPINIEGLVESKKFARVYLQEFVPEMFLNKDKYVQVWVQINEETSERTISNIPIGILQPVKSPFNVIIEETEAEVKLVGKREILDTLNVQEINIFLDIQNLDAGVYQLPLAYRIPDRLLLDGLKVKSITPSSIEVTIEAKP
ncbi:hypothetical protein J7L67_10195 [bacterium]|nr:hypothetical protein [bacterium]